MPSFKVNPAALELGRAMIIAGQVEDGSWYPMDDYEIAALLGDPPNFGEYARIYLGLDSQASADGGPPSDRAAYAYPFARRYGATVKVMVEALRNIRLQAAKRGEMDVFKAADELLTLAVGARFSDGAAVEDEHWVEVLASGTWTAESGVEVTVTDQHLEDAAAAFAATRDEFHVPLRLGGHDFSLAPAVGYVGALKKSGSKLLALFTDVPAIVKQAFDKKLYRTVSSGLRLKAFTYGGKTFSAVLDHVALLGATLPAVKGLADLQAYMADGQEGVVLNLNQNVEDDMNELEKARADLAAAQTKVTELEAKNAEQAKTIANFTEAQAKTTVEGAVDVAVRAGKLLPAQRDQTIAVGMQTLSVANFSQEKNPAWEAFKGMLESAGKVLNFNEKANAGGDDETKSEWEAGVAHGAAVVEKLQGAKA